MPNQYTYTDAQRQSLRLRWPKEYRAWISCRQRCNDTQHHSYADYGGRGIRVCRRWNSFANFLADLGPCPVDYTLDRKRNNGNYTPSNCRWVLHLVQMRNRRTTLKLRYDGATRTLFEWAEIVGLPYETLRYRLRAGWPAADLLTTPVRRQRRPPDLDGKIRWAVARAVQEGQLRRPAHCQVKGCTVTQLHAHHYRGYTQKHWLSVRWLCNRHHRQAERQLERSLSSQPTARSRTREKHS